MSTFYLEVAVFGALLGLPFLYETRPAFCYCLKFSVYIGVVMANSILLMPVFALRPRNVLNLVIASYFCRWVTNLLGVKWIVRNGERLQPQEPSIILSNHQSILDVLGMFQLWPIMGRCTVIAKNAVFWVWPLGLAAWLAGLVFIPRTKTDEAKNVVNRAVKKISHEKTKLWIFPEGTRRNTGEIHPFKKGAFHAAISAQLPIIPIVYSQYYFLDRPTKRFDQGVVIMQVLEPISTKGVSLDEIDSFAESVREKMSQTIKKINQEAIHYPESGSQSLISNSLK